MPQSPGAHLIGPSGGAAGPAGPAGVGTSADAGNLLVRGSDNGAYFDGTVMVGSTATPRVLLGAAPMFAQLTVRDDGSGSGTWIERLTFHYDNLTRVRKTGYFNEYGEIRSIAAQLNTVAARFFGKEFTADGTRDVTAPILEVCDDRDLRTRLFASFSNGNAVVAGTITAANLPGTSKIAVQNTAPSTPAVNDVWIDTT